MVKTRIVTAFGGGKGRPREPTVQRGTSQNRERYAQNYSRLSLIRLSLFRTFHCSNEFSGSIRSPSQTLTKNTP